MKLEEKIPVWKAYWEIEKYNEGESEPYEVSWFEDNLALNVGKAEIWNLLIGSGANHFDNTNAQIGVGDDVTAEAATQTDLVAATNKTYKGMDAGFPSQITTTTTDDTISMQATFGGADANYDWNEFVMRQAVSLICLNRKVSAQGTKASGQTWVIGLKLQLT